MSRIINADNVLDALARHVGEANAIHAGDLVSEILGVPTEPVYERQLRYAIEYLRSEQGAHICGLPEYGYYMAANEGELNRTCERMYSRGVSHLQKVAAMKRVSLPDLRGQLRLPS